jgi:hypothetical protein
MSSHLSTIANIALKGNYTYCQELLSWGTNEETKTSSRSGPWICSRRACIVILTRKCMGRGRKRRGMRGSQRRVGTRNAMNFKSAIISRTDLLRLRGAILSLSCAELKEKTWESMLFELPLHCWARRRMRRADTDFGEHVETTHYDSAISKATEREENIIAFFQPNAKFPLSSASHFNVKRMASRTLPETGPPDHLIDFICTIATYYHLARDTAAIQNPALRHTTKSIDKTGPNYNTQQKRASGAARGGHLAQHT